MVFERSGRGVGLMATERKLAWLLAALVVLLYAPALDGEVLNWDDAVWLDDPLLQLPLGAAVVEAFTTARDRAFYPLLRLAWWAEVRATGRDLAAMHATNVLLFASSLPVVSALLSRCGVGGAANTVALALWAFHPTRVESVAWLTSLKDVLALLLCGLAGLCWIPAPDQPRRDGPGVALMVAAGLVKVAVVPLGVVFALIVAARDGRRDAARAVGPALVAGALTAGVGVAVFHGAADPAARPYADPASNVAFAFWQVASWSWRLVDVRELAAIVPVPASPWAGAAAGLAVVGAVVAYGVYGASPYRWAWVALGLAPLVPVCGVVSMPFWAADRHLLVPGLAAAVAVAVASDARIRAWGSRARFAPLWLAVPLAWFTSARIPDWSSSLALWEAEAHRPGDHWVRGLQLGTTYGTHGRFREAVDALRRAEAIRPREDVLIARRIIAGLAADGSWTKPDQLATAALNPEPKTAEAWTRAAAALVDAADLEAARDAANQAVFRGADDLTTHMVLAVAAHHAGEPHAPHVADAARAARIGVDEAEGLFQAYLARAR